MAHAGDCTVQPLDADTTAMAMVTPVATNTNTIKARHVDVDKDVAS
jgi:hypothetical protein